METLLQHLMNCGFVIFELDYDVPKFAIEKITTPWDGRSPEQFPEGVFNTTFDSFHAALKKAEAVSRWKPETILQMWSVQCMHQHRGRGVLFADLAPVVSETYELAMIEARRKAEQFITETFPEGHIERWEVKIRPCGTVREAPTTH